MDAISEVSPHKVTTGDALAALDNLDIVAWTNLVLGEDYEGLGTLGPATTATPSETSSSSRLSELERRLTALVGALDIAAEETSGGLERALDDLARTAPRLTYDLHFAREGARTLELALTGVQSQATAAEANEQTSAALTKLAHLDLVKTRMSAARDVLQEAERWSSLEGDVGAFLAAQKYEAAAARLAEAGSSMDLFENTPEYEARRSLMVSLQNQLEASLSAALVAAIEGRDADVCRAYYAIFTNIQRESEFRTYFYGARRAAVVEAWQNAKLSDCGTDSSQSSTPGGQTLASFLPTFYHTFLSMLQNERGSISGIFPDPQATMSALLSTTMSSLNPSFAQRLGTAANNHGSEALTTLISALKATEEFAIGFDKIMQKIDISAPQPSATAGDGPADETDPQTAQRGLARRQSSRKSISHRTAHRKSISGMGLFGLSQSAASEWERALFEPFLSFQADYLNLEQRLLELTVQEALTSEIRHGDQARALRERAVDVFSAVEDAFGRCAAFTHGYGAAGLVRAIDAVIAGFVNSSRDLLASSGTSVASKAPASQQAELYDLDYSAADWSAIQTGLHVLGAARALSERLASVEGSLSAALKGYAGTVNAARLDPGGAHVPGTTKGELELLSLSALNSAELAAVLHAAEETPVQNRPAFLSPSHSPRPPHASGQGDSGPGKTLVQARTALTQYARSAQKSLHNTLLGPLRNHLASYPTLSLWVSGAEGQGQTTAAPIPTFSLSPSPPAQRVADGLLNLPRLFEAYAHDTALAFSLSTLPFVDETLLRALAMSTGEAADEPPPTPSHSRRSPSISLRGPPAPVREPTPPPLTSEAVSSAWLCSLGRAIVAHLTQDVLPRIAVLGPSGAAQLAADLGYLETIVQALNVEPSPLERWRRAVEMEEVELRRVLASSEAGSATGVTRMVGKQRGWVH